MNPTYAFDNCSIKSFRTVLLSRTVYPEAPLRVEYTLTDLGNSAYPILEMMHMWGVNKLGLVDQPE